MVYGNGIIGAKLIKALEKTEIEVVAVMDKVSSSDEEGTVLGINSEMPKVDCIVVTPVFYYDEIYRMLRNKTGVPLVSMQDIVMTARSGEGKR